ncbi:hypothetical protein BM221_007353 [Beauveria bassiana]|uniref:Uncharacterized protein n=1 Tax=Beauveria bassiana TaxID=176275 RepID=A0A2N6NGM8_BEABA|nr:hypothetical protein BM221_007353 [Beauveria bassiana]
MWTNASLYLETHPDEKSIENPYNVGATILATNEARAYQRLGPLQGIVVPRFYGSYTVDIPVPQSALQHHHAQPRPVRLVLYEYINGTQLSSAEARPARCASSASTTSTFTQAT